MTVSDVVISRRALLTVTVAGLVTACTTRRRPAAAVDPDAAAIATARDGELRLLAAYDAAHPARALHLEHLRALGGTASAPPAAATSLPGAAAAERASVATLQAAADTAHGGATAALLASIAASHAVLAQPTARPVPG